MTTAAQPTDPTTQRVTQMLRDIIAPLVDADGGELYVLQASDSEVKIHLAGRFSGCPGTQVLTRQVVEPAIRAVAPAAKVSVSSGLLIPEGAVRLRV